VKTRVQKPKLSDKAHFLKSFVAFEADSVKSPDQDGSDHGGPQQICDIALIAQRKSSALSALILLATDTALQAIRVGHADFQARL